MDINFKQLDKLTCRLRHQQHLLPILEQFATGIHLITDLSFAAYVSNQEDAESLSVIRVHFQESTYLDIKRAQ
jgi:hypothetical protein